MTVYTIEVVTSSQKSFWNELKSMEKTSRLPANENFHFSVSKISQSNKPFNLNLTFLFFVITAVEFYTSALVYMI
jgi:hypothetical protein